MGQTIFPLPIAGIHKGFSPEETPEKYSGDMSNVRPVGPLETRIRLGQRPPLIKWSETQIGGDEQPIIEMGVVSIVED